MSRFSHLQRYARALITGRMPDNYTPLQYAASIGDARSIRVLLDAGINIDVGAEDMTPLRLAIYSGKMESIRLLLERGANTSGEGVRHALRWAELTGRTDIVTLLKQAGVDASS